MTSTTPCPYPYCLKEDGHEGRHTLTEQEFHYNHLKDGTRWERFSHNELQMIRYGLAQIYDSTKDDINNMLKELNSLLSPKTIGDKGN